MDLGRVDLGWVTARAWVVFLFISGFEAGKGVHQYVLRTGATAKTNPKKRKPLPGNGAQIARWYDLIYFR